MEFPGYPVVRTLCFHNSGRKFQLWLRNEDSACPPGVAKKIKYKQQNLKTFQTIGEVVRGVTKLLP